MADDKDKDSTSGSDLPSADGTPGDQPVDGPEGSTGHTDDAADQPVELGSEADDGEPFASEVAAHESDTDGTAGDPDAGDDVPEELREDPEADPSDDRELVSVGAPARIAAGDDAATGSARGRAKKDKATPKQSREVEKVRRTGPVKFVKESAGELRKVVYPTGQQLAQYFVVVLIFVLFIIGIVSLLDLGFGWTIFKIFS